MKEIRCPSCHTSNYVEVWPGGAFYCLTCGEFFSARESYGQNLVKMISKASKMVMDRKKSEKPKSLIGKAPELLALSRYTGRLVSKAPEVVKLIKLFL